MHNVHIEKENKEIAKCTNTVFCYQTAPKSFLFVDSVFPRLKNTYFQYILRHVTCLFFKKTPSNEYNTMLKYDIPVYMLIEFLLCCWLSIC